MFDNNKKPHPLSHPAPCIIFFCTPMLIYCNYLAHIDLQNVAIWCYLEKKGFNELAISMFHTCFAGFVFPRVTKLTGWLSNDQIAN